MRGIKKKFMDIRMATDMIGLARAGSYDIAALISSNRGFVPVALFLETGGIKAIQGDSHLGHASAQAARGKCRKLELPENFRFTRLESNG